jgi:GTPase SAR1 family protein
MAVDPALYGAVTGVVATLIVAFSAARIMRQRLPVAYRVAVLGFPRSGKTTLIIAMFGEMFARRLVGYDVHPRGESTIERVNADLESLELGRPLGTTTDQDLFAFRADVIARGGIFPRIFKVEIGDFPGEDTVKFAEEFGDWFHQTPYFKWAMEADAFIFVADLAAIRGGDSAAPNVARTSRAIRAAWQRLQEHHLEGARRLSSKPVALVFMKEDLLFPAGAAAIRGGPISRDPLQVEQGALMAEEDRIVGLFGDLLAFLRSQARVFRVIFVSAFAVDKCGRRLGVNELLRFILPRVGFHLPVKNAQGERPRGPVRRSEPTP